MVLEAILKCWYLDKCFIITDSIGVYYIVEYDFFGMILAKIIFHIKCNSLNTVL